VLKHELLKQEVLLDRISAKKPFLAKNETEGRRRFVDPAVENRYSEEAQNVRHHSQRSKALSWTGSS